MLTENPRGTATGENDFTIDCFIFGRFHAHLKTCSNCRNEIVKDLRKFADDIEALGKIN